ncbi:6717_t:CDS:2 [Entrophospora sp. SA101]|nr:6717_t:CDS:2 [Entrophospora sp. SA101]
MSERKEYQVFSRIHVNMRTTIILQDTGFAFTILQDIRTLNPPLAKNSFAKKNISDELRKETCIYAKKHSKQQSKGDSRFEPINALNANETGAEKLKSLVIGHYKRPRFCQSILTDQQEIDEQLVIEDTLSDTEIVEMAGFRRRYAN